MLPWGGVLIGGGRPSFFVNITTNTVDFNLRTTLMASPYNWDGTTACYVLVGINTGVQVTASSTGTAAFVTGSFPSGSDWKLINLGSIKGKGGAGGSGSDSSHVGGSSGSDGGPALNIHASLAGHTEIDNGSGEIFGGGGGAGGGFGNSQTGGPIKDPHTSNYGGGGGAGGAGSGAGGNGGPGVDGNGNNGNPGTTSGGGTGGLGAGNAFNGGNGGAFGAAGDAGNHGAGGAGKAIELNGGAAPTWLSGNDGTHVKGTVS